MSDQTARVISDTNNQTNALQAVRDEQIAKQKALQDQANTDLNNTTAQFSPEAQKRQIEEQSAKATANLQLSPEFIQASQPMNTTLNQPAVVQDAINKRLAISNDKANTYATNLGALEGVGANTFLNNLSVSQLAQGLATKGKLSQSQEAVANEADKVRALDTSLGQSRIDAYTAANKAGGINQAAGVAGTIKNAALFAALTGGVGAAGNTGAIGAEGTAVPGTFGSYGPQAANARLVGGSNPAFLGGLF